MTTDDPCLLDLVEVGLQSGRLSSVEVTQAMFARIAKLDPHLVSYATFTADLALAQAKQADAEIVCGDIRGPVHGVQSLRRTCATHRVRLRRA
jgi:amidase